MPVTPIEAISGNAAAVVLLLPVGVRHDADEQGTGHDPARDPGTLGLLPGTAVEFDIVGNSVRIRKAGDQRRGAGLIGRMREAGRRAAGPRMTTDQILALTRGE